jgi:hypothetical protein
MLPVAYSIWMRQDLQRKGVKKKCMFQRSLKTRTRKRQIVAKHHTLSFLLVHLQELAASFSLVSASGGTSEGMFLSESVDPITIVESIVMV